MPNPDLLPEEEKQRIYTSQQNDTWDFKQSGSGVSWVRTASNYEVVGTSHRAFNSMQECETNAMLVGYKNFFTVPKGVLWEFYQDAKKEYRWRLVDSVTGSVLNNAHEGYKTEIACLKNAVRHGYGREPIVSTAAHKNTEQTGMCRLCTMFPTWLGWLLIAAIALLLIKGCEKKNEPQPAVEGAPVVIQKQTGCDSLDGFTPKFSDVVEDDWFAPYVQHMVNKEILDGYKNAQGVSTGKFGPGDEVTLSQLAKIALESTNVNLRTCSIASGYGGNWAAPYIECARYRGSRVFADLGQDFEKPATRAEVAAAVIDAFGRSKDDNVGTHFYDVERGTQYRESINTLAYDGIVEGKDTISGTGFDPNGTAQRSEVAKIFCKAIEKYGK